MVEVEIYPIFIVCLDIFEQKFLGSPLFQMLTLPILLDDLLANFALSGVSVASDCVGSCLIGWNEFMAVWALDIFFALFVELLLCDKLLFAT